MRKFIIPVLLLVLLFSTMKIIWADQLEDITKEIDSLKTSLKNKEIDQSKLLQQLSSIKSRVVTIEQDVRRKEEEVRAGEKVLNYQREILNKRVFSYYKNIHKSSTSLLDFFISGNLSRSLQNFFYQQTLVDEDKRTILKVVRYVVDLEEKKKNLQSEKARLLVINEEVDKQAKLLGTDIASTQQKVADLSAKQQQLIAAKQAALVSVAGKSIDTQTTSSTCGSQSISYPPTIRVKFPDGHIETMPFEDQYLKGLGEMPRAWESVGNSQEAFKAQVVAARSYALYKMVRSSCRDYDVYSTTADQVYNGGTDDGNWNSVVVDTKGQFLQNGSNVIIAYYSANSGGHTLSPQEAWNGGGGYPPGVDDAGGDGKPNGDLNARCIGTLRWEYHYNIGRDGKIQYNDTCSGDINNNNSPMTNSEVEDVVDAATWAVRNGHVPDNSISHDQIKSDIGGDAVGTIQSISASIADNKYTNNVHVAGSNRTIDFSGDQAQTFRLVFNIRSPGQFLIPSTTYGAHNVKFDILSSSDAHGTQGQGWYFYTYGYGHRIGLDQEGALGMASQGKSYADILSHYYSGSTLTSKDYSGQVQ